jgi:hypothetical protein
VGHLVSHLFPGAVQTLSHGRLGNSQQGRHLGRRHPFQVVEDNGLSGVRCELVDGIQHCFPALGTLQIAVGRFVAGQMGCGGIEDFPRWLSLSSVDPGATAVFHDRSQPAREQDRILKAVESQVGAQERLLGDVAGVVEIAGPGHRYRKDGLLVALDQAGE